MLGLEYALEVAQVQCTENSMSNIMNAISVPERTFMPSPESVGAGGGEWERFFTLPACKQHKERLTLIQVPLACGM